MLETIIGGRYYILRHLGGGGFGQTYIAEDRQLPGYPQCVVKQLKPQATDEASLEAARRLFKKEAEILHQLGSHSQIPRLLAHFEEHEEFYLIQEFIEGCSLTEEIQAGGQFSEAKVIDLLREILEILSYVHRQNVIHRDVNPQNIIRRSSDGKLVLIDFGAVKEITSHSISGVGHTNLSISIGTPGYMPSEQTNGYPKPSSDVYAVGILGLYALSGLFPNQLPIDENSLEIMWRKGINVSDEFGNFLDKMLCYDFRHRYSSAGEALQALNSLHQGTFLVSNSPSKPVDNQGFPALSWQKILLGLGSLVIVGGVSFGGWQIFNNSNAISLYHQAGTLIKLDRSQEALERLDRAIELKPNFAEAWDLKAEILYELKSYDSALKASDKSLEIQPMSWEAWRMRGLIFTALKQYKPAVDAFDQCLKIEPNRAEVWYRRGEAFKEIPNYQEAVISYDKALEIEAGLSEAWVNRGWVLHQLQQFQEAVNSYRQALQLKANDSKVWYFLGNSLSRLNEKKEAVTAYQEAVKISPSYHQVWKSLGNVLLDLKEYMEAIEANQKLVELKPDDAEAWYNLGWAWHQMGRFDKAIKAYNQALDLDSKNAPAWYNLGNVQFNLKSYEPALNAYQSALSLQPENSSFWYGKGNALFELKRYEDAKICYEKAIELQPNFREAVEGFQQTQKILDAQKRENKGLSPLKLPF